MGNYVTSTSDKKKGTAMFLCALGFFGFPAGLHKFYTGKIGSGLLYLFTFGLFWIGTLSDFYQLLTGSFRDNVGQPLRE